MAKNHKPKLIQRAHVYTSQDAAMKERDKQASQTVGVDIVVQAVPGGYIVRPLELTKTEERIRADGPKFRTHAERSAYVSALQDEIDYQRAMANIVHAGKSKEPKSIHAEVPVRSIARPKMGSKRKEHEDSAYARTGKWRSDHQGWRKLPRVG